jgi:predicted RNA-binding protein YlxR (DUF448 family)
MVKRKRIPIRTCVSCGLKAAKRELLRIVSSHHGRVEVDSVGKLNGRGAYLCAECRSEPVKLRRGRIEHSLKTDITEEEWGSLLSAVVITADTGSVN